MSCTALDGLDELELTMHFKVKDFYFTFRCCYEWGITEAFAQPTATSHTKPDRTFFIHLSIQAAFLKDFSAVFAHI
jgi:hypothetical protein